MVNSPANINKINGGVSPIKNGSATQGANPFVQDAITNLWSFIDTSLTESNFSWHDNIQQQISGVESQTQVYKNALATPYGNSLNINS
ncbi:MAG: hypothetical protein WCK67_09540 [bacterium]